MIKIYETIKDVPSASAASTIAEMFDSATRVVKHVVAYYQDDKFFQPPQLFIRSVPTRYCWENDGNTPANGTEYEAYLALSLAGSDDHVDLSTLRHQYSCGVLSFHVEVVVRDSDDSRRGVGTGLCFLGSEVPSEQRIWYASHASSSAFTLGARDYSLLVRRIDEYRAERRRVDTFAKFLGEEK
jgi:hypothetical protein